MNAVEYREVGRNPDGSIMLRVRLLAIIGRLCGVQFKVGGWPYGAEYRRSITYRAPGSNVLRTGNAETAANRA